MTFPQPAPIREYGPVDRDRLDREIRPAGEPAVFRGQAGDWAAVRAADSSDEALVDYLKARSAGKRVTAIVGQPEIGGRFFYSPDLAGFNFERGTSPLEPFLDRLLRDRGLETPMAMAVQSEVIADLLPGFEEENWLGLVPAEVRPRAWIGNRIRVAPHYDLFENVGVVVAGRRRFTLFPPDQIGNLYVGPLELTPAGAPVSLVDLADPDLDRFPKFAAALASAQTAELGPGDAIYIPYHWWHGVDSLEPFNLFVNYWWNEAGAGAGRPYDALIHALFALKPLPADQKAAWRAVFNHYVFGANGDPAAHLPEPARGVLGEPTPALLGRMRSTLRQILAEL